jgi:hypothetical protein
MLDGGGRDLSKLVELIEQRAGATPDRVMPSTATGRDVTRNTAASRRRDGLHGLGIGGRPCVVAAPDLTESAALVG